MNERITESILKMLDKLIDALCNSYRAGESRNVLERIAERLSNVVEKRCTPAEAAGAE